LSNTIRVYYPDEGKILRVTAFVGKGGNHSVQFTMGDAFSQLTQVQVVDLIKALQMRLLCEPGYAATDLSEHIEIDSVGDKV